MSYLTAFNNQLLNLVNNLSDMYPNDNILELTKTSIVFMKKNNPRKLQHMFSQYVSKYEHEIINHDSKFLLDKNFVEDDLDLDNINIDHAKSVMLNLKKYWSTMDSESHTNIWKYLQVLIILNKKCR